MSRFNGIQRLHILEKRGYKLESLFDGLHTMCRGFMVDELLRLAKRKAFIPEKDQKRMTRYCTKMGYLEKREDGFHITRNGRERLKKGDPRCLDKKAAKERHLKIVEVLHAAATGLNSTGENSRIVAYCKKQGYLRHSSVPKLTYYDFDLKHPITISIYYITEKGVQYLLDTNSFTR